MAIAGHLTTVQLDNAAGALQNISTYVNSVSGLDLARATLDSTAFGDSAQAFVLGLRTNGQVSLSGDFDATFDTQMTGIEALTTGATQTLKVSFGGTGTGTKYVQVETLLANYAVSAAVGDKVTWSASLQRTGTVTVGTN
jgi:hypothetical protein